MDIRYRKFGYNSNPENVQETYFFLYYMWLDLKEYLIIIKFQTIKLFLVNCSFLIAAVGNKRVKNLGFGPVCS